jgi:hypothetical protein
VFLLFNVSRRVAFSALVPSIYTFSRDIFVSQSKMVSEVPTEQNVTILSTCRNRTTGFLARKGPTATRPPLFAQRHESSAWPADRARKQQETSPHRPPRCVQSIRNLVFGPNRTIGIAKHQLAALLLQPAPKFRRNGS